MQDRFDSVGTQTGDWIVDGEILELLWILR